MDMEDIFRRLFGLRSPYNRDRFLVDDHDNDGDDDDNNDYDDENEHFHNDNQEGIRPHSGLEDIFSHFHGYMQRQMDADQIQMEEMIRGFGVVDFSSVFQSPTFRAPTHPRKDNKVEEDGNAGAWLGSVSPFLQNGKTEIRKSPRDFMLKEDNVEQMPSEKQNTPIVILPHEDSDLDGKISEDKLMDLIKKPKQKEPCNPEQPQQMKSSFFSFSKSFSFSSFRGPEVRVEEKRTVRDSSGRQESTVTMKLGDKSYTVTEVTLPDGKQEKKATYNNIDERDVGKFLESWTNPNDRSLMPPPQSPQAEMDPRDAVLFSKLFGPK